MLHVANDINFCQEFSNALPGFSRKNFYRNLSPISNGSLKSYKMYLLESKDQKIMHILRINSPPLVPPPNPQTEHHQEMNCYLINCPKATSTYFVCAIEVICGRS